MKFNLTSVSLLAAIPFASIVFSQPIFAQLTIPQRMGQNTCWYMSKGQPVVSAMKFAANPMMLLIDQTNYITPGYVRQNGAYIQGQASAYVKSVGVDAFSKQFIRSIVNNCGNRLSRRDYDSFMEKLSE